MDSLPALLQQGSGSDPSGSNIIAAIQASTLISTYFFAHGHSIEGSYHANMAAGLTMCTGLHKLRINPARRFPSSPLQHSISLDDLGDDDGSMGSGGGGSGGFDLLPPPNGRSEAVERLMAFWNVFFLERSWSAACGRPVAGCRSGYGAQDGGGGDERLAITASWPLDNVRNILFNHFERKLNK